MRKHLLLRLVIFLHLFLVYISWGTTYLGFSLTLEVVGPFFACGFRMGIGGLLLCLFIRFFGTWKETAKRDWEHAFLYGIFLVVAASGFLSFGQQYVSSGVASIITGSTPITMMLAGWLFAGEKRPTFVQCLGLLGGCIGLGLLSFDQCTHTELGWKTLIGVFWILLATFGWVSGSLLLRKSSRKNPLPPLQDCALLLVAGGLECILLGLIMGEASTMHWENCRPSVLIAFAWMVIGGAILAYSSYFWLLRHVRLAVAVSYEYVVPIIALFLGWWLLDEIVTARMIFAASLAISSVFLIIQNRHLH